MKNFLKEWWNTPFIEMKGKIRLFDTILLGIVLIIMFFLVIPFVNAEENTYFDYNIVEVDTLPTASNDTLNSVYVVNDEYFVTESSTIGGIPTYLPLNTDLINKKIYFDSSKYSRACELSRNASGVYVSWASITTSGNSSFKYMKISSNPYIGLLNYAIAKPSDSSTEVTINTNQNNLGNSVVNCPSNKYFEYFILSVSTTITSVSNNEIYQMFSLTPFESTTTYSWKQVDISQVYRVIPSTIYVPSDNLYCYHFVDSDTLRGYVSNPVVGSDIAYYDFDINHHYRESVGTENIDNYPVCLSNTTNSIWYREDILQILGYFLIFSFFVLFIPIKVFSRLFKRGGL